jgi:hypothetical protein
MKAFFLTAMLALLFASQVHAQYGGGSFFGSGWAARPPMPRWSAPPPTSPSVVRRKNVQPQRAKLRRTVQ